MTQYQIESEIYVFFQKKIFSKNDNAPNNFLWPIYT